MGFASKASIKYIINILLHRESGKAAELYIFYQVIRFCVHSCSTVIKSLSTKDLISLKKALPTDSMFVDRIPKLQAATTGMVLKRLQNLQQQIPFFYFSAIRRIAAEFLGKKQKKIKK